MDNYEPALFFHILMMTKQLIYFSTLMLMSCGLNTSQGDYDKQVNALYDRMSMDERVAQLRSCFMDELFGDDGELDTAKCSRLIPCGIGHFSQYASQKPMSANLLRDRVKKVQEWLMTNTPNAIPALFHEEVLTGINTKDATIYPQQIGQACSFNPELAERKARQTAKEMRAMGGVLSLSPMVDVCRNPSFNRLEESYGEDAYLSAVMGSAFVRGLQLGDMKKGVGTCSKHYLGYGGGGDADEKELMEEILLPHETMIRQEGSKAVMPGYHAVHGTKCVSNKEILTDILRGYIGFDGMVVSDYTAVDQIPDLKDEVERAAAAINAGNDVDFPSGNCYSHLPEAITRGLVKAETLERAVKNVLRYKFRCGLFDKDAYMYANGNIILDSPEDRATSYRIATQSIVMLLNNGVLPLTGKKKVFLTGPNANTMWAMCGDYSYPSMAYFWKKTDVGSDNPHIVSLKEGMIRHLPSEMQLLYSRGCDWTEEIETLYQELGDERAWEYEILHRKVETDEETDEVEALSLAKESDVIVCAVGENVMLCGENRDRKGLRLPGRQEEYVRKLIATGRPVVLVIFGGRAQVISGIAEECAAIIQAWYPGEEGGNAVADILYGNVSPSGKLSVSYPNTEIHEPICYNYSALNDSRVAWPFGFGLSYTNFEYDNLQVPQEISSEEESFTVSFDIANTGCMDADEVAQIYLSPKSPDLPIRPIQLQGFSRVSMKRGESHTVYIKMYTDQLGYYTSDNARRQWNIQPGDYTIKVGSSSTDIRLSADMTLKGKKVTKPLRDHYFSSCGQ